MWVISEEEPKKHLPSKATNCRKLFNAIVNGELSCKFQTSDWAFSEMVQYFRDRAIFKLFSLDGYEFSAFNRMKHQYSIDDKERAIIAEAISDFEIFLKSLDFEFLKLELNWQKIHDFCLRYSLETPDATHLNIAAGISDYFATIDQPLKKSQIREVRMVDPATLLTYRELRV